MSRTFLVLFVFIPLFVSAQQNDSLIVSELNRNWIASYSTNDTAIMQRILADDFVMISPTGKKLGRMDIIRNVGNTDVTTIAKIDSASVRVFGNTALVVAYLHFSIKIKDQTTNGSNCYSDLYIKRKGEWKAIAAHVTLLNLP
jgi:ketosteroid isomerase-like protein